MKERKEARCTGRHWLFESVRMSDHIQARDVCLGVENEGRCPAFAACEAALRDLGGTQWRSGIHGTWAGKLFGREPRR